jgi:hypothetical protein
LTVNVKVSVSAGLTLALCNIQNQIQNQKFF